MTVRTDAAVPARRGCFAPLAALALIALPLAVFIASFAIGRFPVEPFTVARILASQFFSVAADWPPVVESVVLDVRLPRVLGAMLVGGALAVAGACYQGVFRNPLVSPFTLGVSAGAGFGAALAILYLNGRFAISASAFIFGLIAVMLCFSMARLYKQSSPLVLVLGGVIVGSLFTALLSLLKYAADPASRLPVIEFWLLGSLSSIAMADVAGITLVMAPAMAMLMLLRWRINLLAMGDAEARALGVHPGRLRLLVVLLSTLLAASAVSVSGIIGWIGLVIPHLTRILFGPDFRILLPATLSFGATYLLLVDDLARSVSSAELPLGILTALIGAPVFTLLLRKGSHGWA